MSNQVFLSAIKRTGDRVPYNSQKISVAIRKAFDSSKEDINEHELAELVQGVENQLVKVANGHPIIHIEQIQDAIERELMLNEYFNTAKNFIIYRQRHAENRLTQTMSKRAKAHTITVVKKDGKQTPFNLNKILSVLREASAGVNTHQAPLDPILLELEKNIFEGIHTKEVLEALVLSTVSFIERDPGYDIIAARVLKHKLYNEVIARKISYSNQNDEQLKTEYRAQFVNSIKEGVVNKHFTEQLLEYDLEALSQELIIEQDNLFQYLGLRTLYERYFVKHEGKSIETPQAFWMRVAMGLALNEEDKHEYTIKFYKLISQLRYIPSTPTLFHSGLTHPQLSSCYISTVGDDLSNIFKCIGDNAQMAKWSGGIGNDWTSVRATNSRIKSTNVESQGVIPFLKIANDTTLAINRSGKRRGATCAYLETWHLDIEDFIDLRRNTGDDRRRTHDMNIANWIPDLFMKRVEQEADWTLFSPNETPDLHETYGADFEARYIEYEKKAQNNEIHIYKTVSATKLWRRILTRLFETGHPWITFKDPCNIRSPQDHEGVIHSSNLCTEITLNNSSEETAVCNLGSINLGRHVTSDGVNQYLLQDTINTALRMLDNVIDINFYPTKEAKQSNMRHRPVGLGIMGLQDVLYKLRLPFTGQKTIDFMDQTMEFISYYAILASSQIAKEKGAYESFKGSKWDRGILPYDSIELLEKERGQEILVNRNTTMDWDEVRNSIKKYGMRNSNIMAIAPTATISNIAGCYPCIEPIYKNIYVKSNMNGEFTIINQYLVQDLKELGLWNPKMLDTIKYYDGNIDYIDEIPEDLKSLYKETFEIDSIDLLKLTAVRAKWIDQSQSHNVFIKGASGKKLHDTYMQAWKMGLKTTYYLRTLAASQIEKSTLDAKEYGFTQKRDYKAMNTEQNEVQEVHVDSAQNQEVNVHPTLQKEAVFVDASTNVNANANVISVSASTSTSSNVNANTSINDHDPGSSQEQGKVMQQEESEFSLDSVSLVGSDVGSACSILDPDCEACQ